MQCEEWMERLLAEGVPPIRLTFNSLIKASRSNPARGEHWYRKMREAGIKPNIQTFNKVPIWFSTLRLKQQGGKKT